ncbi:MAG TPA: glycosyltransferase family 2 protein [Acetobacteraceae bacterium]|nr:glycosyltransferase family 2 protein [Acetobacteraceae bacterium]
MRLGAVVCVRDEAHIIEEWIAHHLALGIERLHILDNLSADDTRAKIDRICSRVPSVTVETWNPPADVHRLAFKRGLDIMQAEDVEWCAFIDADEFIACGDPDSSESFAEMLETRHADHAAIGLHWAVFGSSGHIGRPAGLIQEAFLTRAEDDFPPNRHIKTLVRPRHTPGPNSVHGFATTRPYFTTSGEEISWQLPYAYTMNMPQLRDWRLNHYFCQWRERWAAKVARARILGREKTARSEKDWAEHDRNEVFDPTALRWTPRDREMLLRLGCDPDAPRHPPHMHGRRSPA